MFCVGWNYSEHFAEGRGMRGPNEHPPAEIPNSRRCSASSQIRSSAPNAVLSAPVSDQLDWEVELAVIMRRRGRDIPEERAFEHVFGYTVANDVSARDVQRRHGGQWFKGKNFDTHCPLGPWIVTADELATPRAAHHAARERGDQAGLEHDASWSSDAAHHQRVLDRRGSSPATSS